MMDITYQDVCVEFLPYVQTLMKQGIKLDEPKFKAVLHSSTLQEVQYAITKFDDPDIVYKLQYRLHSLLQKKKEDRLSGYILLIMFSVVSMVILYLHKN